MDRPNPLVLLVIALAGCGGEQARELPRAPPPAAPALAPPEPPVAAAEPADAGSDATAAPPVCPAEMAFVDTTYCPKPRLRCLRDEYNAPNHITICHEFAPGQTCLVKPRRERFCIDRYEYPDEEGAHPPVMVSWYDAAAACAAGSKRLCWESEWVSACEGPDKFPFPYGLRRDSSKCNIDNPWVKPELDKVYAPSAAVQGAELLRLDQSVASGERPGCVSGFGVHDLTGNVDEWVDAEEHHEKSQWAGLKGGAWGHVRNACRPMTTSHPPEFTYYFISFRCCADAAPDPRAAKDPTLWTPPAQPDHPSPGGKVGSGWTTDERGPNRPP
jgi:formylglycine-generating enzyme